MKTETNETEGFQIGLSFAHLLHRIGQIAADKHLGEFGRDGLSARQFAVLAALSENSKISQTELVRITNIDRSTMAEIVKRLLDKNLIERTKSKTDARANILRLSENGEKEFVAALPKARKIDIELLSGLSEKNQVRVFEIFSTLLKDEFTSLRIKGEKPPKSKKAKKSKKLKKSQIVKPES